MVERPPLLIVITLLVPAVLSTIIAFAAMWLQVGRLDVVVFTEDFTIAAVITVALCFVSILVVVFGFGPEQCHRCTKRILWHKVEVKDYPNRHFDTDDWTGETYEHIPMLVYHRACYIRNKRNELTV